MSDTIFKFLATRSSHVSIQRKVWLLVVTLLLAEAIFAYHSGFTNEYFTRPWLTLIIVFLSLNLVTGILSFLIVSTYRQRSHVPAGEQDNFILGIDALGRTIVIVATLASILPIFGIQFHQFLTSFSLVAVATVLIFKDIIANFIDGYRLMFSSDLLIGDYIKVNDSARGVIRDITFHSTKLRTDDGNILYVPNTQLINGEVINFSKLRYKRIVIDFKVPTKVLANSTAFEDYLLGELTQQFGEMVDPDKVFLRIEKVEKEDTECKYEISVDQYSFKIETKITKFVYQKVIDYVIPVLEAKDKGE